ncbi:MAG: hypothetical protein JOZ96_02905 [Acidobacteria bacterium]|nr:hypothetical protein [Acidobacteriota bacterium]
MKLRLFSLAAAAALLAAAVSSVNTPASAASTVVVTPSNQQGWTTAPPVADNRPVSTVQFVTDATAPAGTGALQLTTDSTNASKAQYMHTTNTALADITDLGYYTKQNSASSPVGDPSYQLAVCLNGVDANTGACLGYTTLVYEPYWNGSVTPGVWQHWDVDAGQFWSSRAVTCSNGAVIAGAGGPPLYTLSAVEAMCPNAVVGAFGVNIGTYNPSYNVETDLFTFNDTTYNFEVYSAPSDKDQCKNGGWATFSPNRPAGPFKNQGDCIQYANTGK